MAGGGICSQSLIRKCSGKYPTVVHGAAQSLGKSTRILQFLSHGAYGSLHRCLWNLRAPGQPVVGPRLLGRFFSRFDAGAGAGAGAGSASSRLRFFAGFFCAPTFLLATYFSGPVSSWPGGRGSWPNTGLSGAFGGAKCAVGCGTGSTAAAGTGNGPHGKEG
jgi:hypothetical protein